MFQVRQRLQKLDFYFDFLRVMSEDCRQRMLCEVTRDADRFYPLSSVFVEATRYQELLGSFYATDVVESATVFVVFYVKKTHTLYIYIYI